MEERIIKLETALLLSKKGFCHGSPFFYNCFDNPTCNTAKSIKASLPCG